MNSYFDSIFCILFILSNISSVILLWFSIFQCRVSNPIAVWLSDNIVSCSIFLLISGWSVYSNNILIAINSPNNIDPLLQTGCFSSVVSSSTHTIAPAPHGPGLLRHEPSVNAIAVFSVVSVIFWSIKSLPLISCSFVLVFDDPKFLQYSGGDSPACKPWNWNSSSMFLPSIFVSFFISSPCKHINPNGDICLSVVSFLLHLSSWFLMGNFVEYELIFPMSLMAISSLLMSKGITPDITSIASKLAVDGKPIDNPLYCV